MLIATSPFTHVMLWSTVLLSVSSLLFTPKGYECSFCKGNSVFVIGKRKTFDLIQCMHARVYN